MNMHMITKLKRYKGRGWNSTVERKVWSDKRAHQQIRNYDHIGTVMHYGSINLWTNYFLRNVICKFSNADEDCPTLLKHSGVYRFWVMGWSSSVV